MTGAVDCRDCAEAARIWHWGGYASPCRGCVVRALAKSPREVRQAGYQRLATPEERKALIGQVQAEAKRIAALKAGGDPC